VIFPAASELQQQLKDNHATTPAAAAELSDDEHRHFSASIRVQVSHTVTSPHYDSDDAEDDQYTASQSSSSFPRFGGSRGTDAVGVSAVAAPQSLVLKSGWLRKLARFGRDMKRWVAH
jgi:hypothetical protein